jgi:hypothetical protein
VRNRLIGAAAAAAVLSGAVTTGASGSKPPACGAASAATVGAVDASIVAHVYANELAGPEVSADLQHVISASDLSTAVAQGNQQAVLAATTRIVYHPRWHIVRLRVTDLKGRLLADVGGPYIAAPVTGTISAGGRPVGRFVMSVQDDHGVVKLEFRFVGDPAAIYVGSTPVTAYGAVTFPAGVPRGPTITLAGTTYHVETQTISAFPTGTAIFVTLVPPPSRAVSAQPCTVVRANEYGLVAATLARLASNLPSNYAGFASAVHIYSGALVFVRVGSQRIASSGGPGPNTIPVSGSVSYQGRNWLVYSFQPTPPARVYLLVPPS